MFLPVCQLCISLVQGTSVLGVLSQNTYVPQKKVFGKAIIARVRIPTVINNIYTIHPFSVFSMSAARQPLSTLFIRLHPIWIACAMILKTVLTPQILYMRRRYSNVQFSLE